MLKYRITFIHVGEDFKASTASAYFDDLNEALQHLKGMTKEYDRLYRDGKIYNFRSTINSVESWEVNKCTK